MSKWMLFLFLGLFQSGWCANREFKSLTGGRNQPKNLDFGDPSPPDFSQKNIIHVYTTGGFVLSWRGANALENFLSGKSATVEQLKIFHPDSTPLNVEAGEDVWDPTIEASLENPRERVLYGSVMSPVSGKSDAQWPQDNWSRRTYAFHLENNRWIREDEPLIEKLPRSATWLGHNYGHQFIKDQRGQTFVFYEKVTEERAGLPWKTEIFAKKMKDSWSTTGEEISILKVPSSPWPSSRRSFGGSLLEGPRPFFSQGKYFISFSAGEYASANYGIHLAWSERIEGPYNPVLERNNLKDYGQQIETKRKLTWGAARASFFEVNGIWWTLFHGIDQVSDGPIEEGRRNIFLAPVEIQPQGRGPFLEIVISD
jgi:Glycosyl hydrolases family 43